MSYRFNVNGLNHPAIRTSLWIEALRLKADILCIQETHFHGDHTPNLHHKLFPHIYMAFSPSKQRGVLIAIKNSEAFNLQELHTDPEGRYLIVICELNNKLYTIANLYTPNSHQTRFLQKMFCKIPTRCFSDMQRL